MAQRLLRSVFTTDGAATPSAYKKAIGRDRDTMKESQGGRRSFGSGRPGLSRGHQPSTEHSAKNLLPLFRLRWLVALGLVLSFLSLGEASATAAEPFGFPEVAEQAQRLAAEPFKSPPLIPDFLSRLSYDDYRDIRF